MSTPTTALTTFNLAEAGIQRGQRAWARIKSTAEEQRTLWLEVGVALMYGKQKGNRKRGQKFSEWVQEVFPGLTDAHDIADSIWLASNSVTVTEVPEHLTHPSRIRRWFNEQQATKDVPEDLRGAAGPETIRGLPKESASKVNKLARRAESGDEGSEIARRHLEAFGRRHGLDVDQLLEAAGIGDPEGRHCLTPVNQRMVEQFRANVQATVQTLESQGISRAAIRHILLNVATAI